MTPGPETSCNMTLSTFANITSSGDNFCLPDALASIFSVIVIPTKTIHAMYVRFCLHDGLKPLEREKHKAQKIESPSTEVLLGRRRSSANIYQNSEKKV